MIPLQWRHNERNGVPNHQRLDCLLNRLFGRRWKKSSKLRPTGLCEGNSPVTGEFPAQKTNNAENVSILWRHHGFLMGYYQGIIASIGFYALPMGILRSCVSKKCRFDIYIYIEFVKTNKVIVWYVIWDALMPMWRHRNALENRLRFRPFWTKHDKTIVCTATIDK